MLSAKFPHCLDYSIFPIIEQPLPNHEYMISDIGFTYKICYILFLISNPERALRNQALGPESLYILDISCMCNK